MSKISLHSGDNRESLRRLIDQGVRVHSVVTDPPYGLVSVQKRFGKEGAAAARTEGNDGSFARLSGGFMGKAWDGTGIERDPEFWKLIYDILLPGGYVFAFSGSRTGHWQAVAMETAGFVMHPMHGWVFGSGFPKAHAADKAIDKHFGAEREVVGIHKRHGGGSSVSGSMSGPLGTESELPLTAPATPEAAQWEGWAYGTQTQKPALEPIYLGQKPFSEKTGAANILKHGVGAVNIDGCRVPTNPDVDDPRLGGAGSWKTDKAAQNVYEGGYAGSEIASSGLGRHPANLIHDGSAEVVALFPNSKSCDSPSTARSAGTILGGSRTQGAIYPGENGSAARFFNCFPPDAPPIFYNAKANKVDRAGSKHPTVKPVALMQHLIRHITPPGGVVLDPFAGSGTTAEAAQREGFDCILMEAEDEYLDFLRERFQIQNSEYLKKVFTYPKEVDLLVPDFDDDPLSELLG